MRVRTLELTNYRRFRSARLEFPDGVIAITGPNGAGKTTLLEGLAWCLFGHDAARTDKDLLKHAGAAPGDDVMARVEFELDGAAYVVTRRMRGKSQQTEAEVTVDGALVVAPGANSSDLSIKYLARALGMGWRGFQSTVFAAQGDVSALSDAKPAERKRLILGLLGVDRVEAAILLARQERRDSAIRLEALRRQLQREPELKQRSTTARRDLDATTSAAEAAATEAAQAETRLRLLQERAEELAAARASYTELRGRLEGLQRNLQLRTEQVTRLAAEAQALEQKQAHLRRLVEEGGRFHGLDERLRELQEVHAAARERRALEAEMGRLDQEIRRWDAALAQRAGPDPDGAALAADVERIRLEVEKAAARSAELEAHALHLDHDRRRLQTEAVDHGGRWRDIESLGPDAACPVCERTLGDQAQRLARRATQEQRDLHERIARIGEELSGLRLQAETFRRSQEDHRSQLTVHERRLLQVRAHEEQQRVTRAERAHAAQRHQALTTQLQALPPPTAVGDADALAQLQIQRDEWRTAVARLETETTRLDRVQIDLTATTAAAETTRADIQAATRELAAVAYRAGTAEAAQNELAAHRTLWHAAETRRQVLAERVQGLRITLDQAERDLALLGDVRRQAATLEDVLRLSETLAGERGDDGLLPTFRNHLISRIRPALARAASGLVAEMTQGRYTELAIDDDYTLRLYDGRQAWPIERFSGGEGDVVHLAVRLAVSELLATARRARRFQIVALDEVLASQDEARRGAVLEALRSLRSHFRQVLMVTHLEEVRERVDHVIHVRPNGDGASRIECSWMEKV